MLDDGGGCNPGAGKTGRRVTEDVVQGGDVDDAAVVDAAPALNRSMASARSTEGEKKRCPERIPS
jgi:hypothetical protein